MGRPDASSGARARGDPADAKLRRDPERRWQRAEDFAAALQRHALTQYGERRPRQELVELVSQLFPREIEESRLLRRSLARPDRALLERAFAARSTPADLEGPPPAVTEPSVAARAPQPPPPAPAEVPPSAAPVERTVLAPLAEGPRPALPRPLIAAAGTALLVLAALAAWLTRERMAPPAATVVLEPVPRHPPATPPALAQPPAPLQARPAAAAPRPPRNGLLRVTSFPPDRCGWTA